MMKIYNTYTGENESIPHKEVLSFYTCGVTIYDYCHIGHARSYIVWDIFKRWLRQNGQTVNHVQNFTDIDDKIVARALKENVSPKEISEKFQQAYFEDMDWLNVGRANSYPTVTDYFDKMYDAAKRLIDLGHAQFIDGDIRFIGSSYHNYGKLSNRPNTTEDFVLWKGPKENEKQWFPTGRPGWHLECSVMIEETLGETIDIHGGGNDLVFPHHENEIAQSECLHCGKPLAKIWVHNGMVEVGLGKMGKSQGNALAIRELRANGIKSNTIRMWILQSKYSKPLSIEPLMGGVSNNQWDSLKERLRNAPDYGVSQEFIDAMNDDMNTPQAVAAIFNNPTKEMALILGFDLAESAIPNNVLQLASQRDKLRKDKNWTEADEIKKEIIQLGYQVRDSGENTIVLEK